MKKLETLIQRLRNIKSFYILIIPDHPGHEAKSTKLTTGKFTLFLAVYSIIIFLLGFFILSETPMAKWTGNQGLTPAEKSKIEQFNKKMDFLTKELESVKSANQRLKYAMILGDSTLADSLKLKDSLIIDSNKRKKSAGGNVWFVVKNLFFSENQSEESISFRKPAEGFISRGFKT